MGDVRADTLRVTEWIKHPNNFQPPIDSGQLAQRNLQEYVLDFTNFRVFDAYGTLLPGAGATDDLGLVGGSFGTAAPSLQTEDLGAAGATNNRARFTVQLPPDYVAGQTVTMRFIAGMITAISDNTATLDLECWLDDEDGTLGAADICTTVATTMNTLVATPQTIDFTINGASLSPGSRLDCQITTAINDGATPVVIGCVLKASLLCDTQG